LIPLQTITDKEAELLKKSLQANYDTRLSELHLQVSLHLSPLLTDPSPSVRRALLYTIPSLCGFFGRQKANDVILAHLVTYLNTRDWLLREKWNEVCAGVAEVVGAKALEEYVLPLIVLSLAGELTDLSRQIQDELMISE